MKTLDNLKAPTKQSTHDYGQSAYWIQFIDEMLLGEKDDIDFTFAEETLNGIRETINRTGKVTDGQERAILNIYNGGERARDNTDDRDRGDWGDYPEY